MTDMMGKVKFLRDNFPLLDIEVDGGVGPKTIQTCAEHGANWIVSGTCEVKWSSVCTSFVNFLKFKQFIIARIKDF